MRVTPNRARCSATPTRSCRTGRRRRPVTEGADGRDAVGDELASRSRRARGSRGTRSRRGAHAVGHRVDRAARRVAQGPESGVGVEMLGEERAEPRPSSTPGALAARSRARYGRLGPPARPRSRRRCSRFEYQLPMAARARRGRPVSRSPIASTNPTTKPNGTSQRSRSSEYEVKSTRTRDRASANSSGRSPRERSVGGFAVARPRVGDDEHARAGEPRPPAQVEVFGTGEGLGIEAAEFLEEVGAHEHGGGRDVEDVAHAVVLLLVELARFDARVTARRSGRWRDRPRAGPRGCRR